MRVRSGERESEERHHRPAPLPAQARRHSFVPQGYGRWRRLNRSAIRGSSWCPGLRAAALHPA